MTTPEDDLLGGVTWVRILTLRNLPALEGIRDRLREKGVGAVIVNDEKFQSLSKEDRAKAIPPGEGFRLEVPRSLVQKAKRLLNEIYTGEEKKDG